MCTNEWSTYRRKREAREVHKNSQYAQKVIGLKAKLLNKKRHSEKIQMKKTYVIPLFCSHLLLRTNYSELIFMTDFTASSSMKKRMLNKRLPTQYLKVLFLPICWIVKVNNVQRSCPTWSSKSVRKRPANGMCHCPRCVVLLKMKCSRLWRPARTRQSHGNVLSPKLHSLVMASLVSLQSMNVLFALWVFVSRRHTLPTLNWRLLSNCLSFQLRRTPRTHSTPN